MPRINADVQNGCNNSETGSPGISKKLLSGKEHSSFDFRAKIIPYDNLEDPNAPILAFSGDNINLIFNIPKESFKKLAVAAIGHLEKDLDLKSPEKSASSYKHNSGKEKESEMSIKSSLNIDKDLDVNTDYITDTYGEDSNDSCKHENINAEDSVLLKNKTKSHNDESASNDGETKKSNRNTETAIAEESLNGFISTFSNSNKKSDSSDEKLNSDCAQRSSLDKKLERSSKEAISNENCLKLENRSIHDSKIECREDESDENVKETLETEKSPHTLRTEQSGSTNQNDDLEEMILSAHSLGFSYEDCPELETVWPVIHPFTEIEKISIKELNSTELSGVLTKYLKLEFSNECIVLKVSSDSNFIVDAVKYKGRDVDFKPEESNGELNIDKHIQSEERSLNSFTCNMCKKSVVGNSNENSVKDSSNVSNQTLDTENAKASDSENKDVTFKDQSLSETELSDEPFEYGTPIKDLDTKFKKEITLQLKQKLEEPDESIPGNSPTERLKYILSDGLKKICNEIEASKQTDELTGAVSKTLDGSEAESSLVKTSTDSNDQLLENDLEDTNSQSEGLSENSQKCCNFQDKIEIPQEADSPDNLSNSESQFSRSSFECASILSSKISEYSSPNKSHGVKENEDETVEKLIQSDDSFTAENSLGDANDSLRLAKIQKESRDHSFENKIDSLEDSGLNNSFCNSENEASINVSIQFENNKSEETDKLENSLFGFQEKANCETNENTAPSEVLINGATEKPNTLRNETIAEVVETSDCQSETAVDAKLESLEDGSEKLIEEKSFSKVVSEIDADSKSIEESIEGKLNTDETLPNGILNSKEKNKLENSEEKSGKSEETDLIRKTSEILQPEVKNTENNRELNDQTLKNPTRDDVMKTEENEEISEGIDTDICEVILSETSDPVESEPSNEVSISENESSVVSISERRDLEPNIPEEETLHENSFASSLDSFMNKTVDTFAESMSEGGDLESDDVKSVASESDDSKDSEKRTSVHKNLKKKKLGVDEVDCAPTRVRRKKIVAALTKDTIPENAEVKNTKTSRIRGSALDNGSKCSGKGSPKGRNLRSKSLDESSQTIDKKHSGLIESEEINRRARAKTPDIISKKDLKVAARSSPRKLARSATTESGTASKVQSTKTNATDKSQANLDSSMSTSKRNKRGNKD